MSNLLEEAEKYRKLAHNFISSSGIMEALNRHGVARFTGSYAAGLMMHGDVDILVIRENEYTNEDILKVFDDIYLSTVKENFRSYYVGGNWDDVRRGEEFPYGHYIGMKAMIGEEKLKFDIWFVSKKEEERLIKERFDITKIDLTSAQIEAILKFKKYRKKNNLSMSGQEIYNLVINKNITEIEDMMNTVN